MTYDSFPEHLRVRSEQIEPAMAQIMGKWFAQCEHMKQTHGARSLEHVMAVQNWWDGLCAMGRLLGTCSGATHAQMAVTNHMRDSKRFIEQELGIQFSLMEEKVYFRSLVKGH